MGTKESPVFFDQTGIRWRVTKWVAAVCFVAVAALAAIFGPQLLTPVISGGAGGRYEPGVSQLEARFNAQNTPVIGKGQFIRAVALDVHGGTGSVTDVFDGKKIRDLTPGEVVLVESNKYALERYGQLPDHRLALTFDDGPDPAYTPQLLNALSRQKVPSTFFVVGANVVKHPDIARREVREGHVVGNHTFSHIDFDFSGTFEGEQEINQTERVLQAATSQRTRFMRVPYAGATDQSLRDSIKGILQAQRMGYVPVSYDYDTLDWRFTSGLKPDPRLLDGGGKILLLHDSGGNRSHTISYVNRLIPMARQAGYQFINLEHAYAGPDPYYPVRPSFADKVSYGISWAFLVLPSKVVTQLFLLNVCLILLVTMTNIALAWVQQRRTRRVPLLALRFQPTVSVIVPAYNEESVLEASVLSILRSGYRKLGVVIVDDGSRDDTLGVAYRLAAAHDRVTVISQSNSGKAAALNNGIRHSSGEIIICIDADTLFQPDTVWRLARHFANPRVGGVAGYVRVGNIRNPLTYWQALEYITSITLERGAQALLDAITVVPGACGAWRREALLRAGGFSHGTLAEDCDVALSVQQLGYTIAQDSTAISHTECPLTLGDLAKQRFRWTFGNIQSFWKHRHMFFSKKQGWLGMAVLPSAALSILLPLIFWPLLVGLTVANILAGRWWLILIYLGLIMILQFVVALIGLLLARESLRYLAAVPMTRLVYGPLKTYILYRSLLTALRGVTVGWNKLDRTKTATDPARSPAFRASQPIAEE